MAYIALTPATTIRKGTVVPSTACDAGKQHSFANAGDVLLVIKNGNASGSITVTFAIPKTVDGVQVPGKAGTAIPFSQTRVFGPFPPSIYNQTDGTVHLDFAAGDTAAGITLGVIKLGA